mmetsp:Transcript_48575/g.101497  ORF Transcript_48575/g.101497 Transcript_48575/m.101497 type:complete len:129 (-) Transcript_48575:85-471(-)
MPRPINIGTYAKEEDAAIAFDNVCRACGVPELQLNFPTLPNICDSMPVTHVLPAPAAAKDSPHTRRLAVGDAVRARYLPDGRWYCAVVADFLLDGSGLVVRYTHYPLFQVLCLIRFLLVAVTKQLPLL